MEAFNFYQFLKPSIRAMTITGTWATLSPLLRNKALQLVAFLLCTTSTLASAVVVLKGSDDAGDFIYALCMTFGCFQGIVKHVVMVLGKSKLQNVLKFLDDPMFTTHGYLNVHMRNTMRVFSIFQYIHFFLMISTATLCMLNPFFGHRLLPSPFPLNMHEQTVGVYVAVCVLMSAAIHCGGIIIGGYDCLILILIGIAVSQLRVLREMILHSMDEEVDGPDDDASNYDDLVSFRLQKCVEYHMKIEEYIVYLQNLFAVPLLVQMLLSLLILIFVEFSCVMTPITSPTFGRTLFFFLSSLTELAIFCVLGNNIIVESEKILEACYMSQWTHCNSSVRKTLGIIMARVQRPFLLTAGGFIDLSLQSLITIMKSSYTYFTILRNMYSVNK